MINHFHNHMRCLAFQLKSRNFAQKPLDQKFDWTWAQSWAVNSHVCQCWPNTSVVRNDIEFEFEYCSTANSIQIIWFLLSPLWFGRIVSELNAIESMDFKTITCSLTQPLIVTWCWVTNFKRFNGVLMQKLKSKSFEPLSWWKLSGWHSLGEARWKG